MSVFVDLNPDYVDPTRPAAAPAAGAVVVGPSAPAAPTGNPHEQSRGAYWGLLIGTELRHLILLIGGLFGAGVLWVVGTTAGAVLLGRFWGPLAGCVLACAVVWAWILVRWVSFHEITRTLEQNIDVPFRGAEMQASADVLLSRLLRAEEALQGAAGPNPARAYFHQIKHTEVFSFQCRLRAVRDIINQLNALIEDARNAGQDPEHHRVERPKDRKLVDLMAVKKDIGELAVVVDGSNPSQPLGACIAEWRRINWESFKTGLILSMPFVIALTLIAMFLI